MYCCVAHAWAGVFSQLATWLRTSYSECILTLLRAQEDETLRTHQLWRYTLGSLQGDADLVYEETDPQFEIGIGMTRSEQFLLLEAASATTKDVRYLPADEPRGAPSGWRCHRP